ncbi:hyccin 2-like isoform X2 [Panonychus citri]|uniref:hyccin 2-like isoform X2 n=1 Tax=Panonychus citri TaxID=50023 RepID=UPI002307A2F6|nr:hyccin 2-like isoform X2 [Panonychus citri]
MSQIVDDWLSEFDKFNQYKNSPEEIHAYAIGVFNFPDLIAAIVNILEDDKSYEKFLAPICTQLFNYHRMKDDRLRLFVISFLPSLINIHLQFSVKPLEVRRKYRCVDTVLLGVYNAEISSEDGLGSNRTFRVPTTAKPSVYHEPPTTSTSSSGQQSTTGNDSSGKPDSGLPFINVPVYGNYKTSDSINASNRNNLLIGLLHLFHEHMSCLPKRSHVALCRMAISVLEKETRPPTDWKDVLSKHPNAIGNLHNSTLLPDFPRKITVVPQFLVRLASCIYFCIYNGVGDIAIQALDHVHSRGLTDLYPDVLLMTNAIKNQLTTNPPTTQSTDGQTGISVPLTSTSTI